MSPINNDGCAIIIGEESGDEATGSDLATVVWGLLYVAECHVVFAL